MRVGDAHPSPGQIYSFRTMPFSEFAPAETGRHAAFKVLGVSDRHVAIAVLDRVWLASPTLREVQKAAILREHRGAHTGRLAVFGVNVDWWNPSELPDAVLLGSHRLSSDEVELALKVASFAPGVSYSTLRFVNYAAEGEWRWAHDREAFGIESEASRAKGEAERAAKDERYRTRLSKLTWDQLLSETPFEQWRLPPEDFTVAARRTIHDACRTLQALGPKPRKAEVRAILRGCVEWFNEADRNGDGLIETEEREDICAVLEEMAYVARQKSLVEEVDTWRDW